MCMGAIEAQKAVAIEVVLQQGVCPRCGARVAAARHQGFVEAGQGLTERLVATCAAGHEWAVRAPAFRWEDQR
jgi:ribosomal protein S27AE